MVQSHPQMARRQSIAPTHCCKRYNMLGEEVSVTFGVMRRLL